jgi:hypothetical protein
MSGGGKNTTTTTKQELDPAMQKLLLGDSGLYKSAGDLYAQGGGQYYPGETYAGMNDVQLSALNNQLNALQSPDAAAGAGAYKKAGEYGMTPMDSTIGRYDLGKTSEIDLSKFMAPVEQIYGRTEDTNNPYLKSAVDSAATRLTDNFNASVMPQIRGGAQEAGQYGSSRHGIAEGIAAKGLSQTVGDMSADMYSKSYEGAQERNAASANAALGANASAAMNRENNIFGALKYNADANNTNNFNSANLGFTAANTKNNIYDANLNRMVTGAGAINTSAAMPLQNNQAAYAIGSTLQGEQQNRTNADLEAWNYYQSLPVAMQQQYAQIVQGGANTGAGQSQTGANPNYTSPAQGAVGGAATGAGIGTSIMPGWGTAIGAGVGGLLGYAGSR